MLISTSKRHNINTTSLAIIYDVNGAPLLNAWGIDGVDRYSMRSTIEFIIGFWLFTYKHWLWASANPNLNYSPHWSADVKPYPIRIYTTWYGADHQSALKNGNKASSSDSKPARSLPDKEIISSCPPSKGASAVAYADESAWTISTLLFTHWMRNWCKLEGTHWLPWIHSRPRIKL